MYKKIVLTGAAGRLGSYLREPIAEICETLVSSDIVQDIGKTLENESYQQADLANYEQVAQALEGADLVVHFGAYADEATFKTILGPNIVGAYNIWESAFQNGLKRVIYASSIHAVGMHKAVDNIDTLAPHKPDTFYGLAKCFTEDLAQMYWDKRGLESVCLRILSCAQVTSERALSTWLSYPDLVRLVIASIEAEGVGAHVVYGVSNNARVSVDNRSAAAKIGYEPQDNAEQFAPEVLAKNEPASAGTEYVGGPFAAVELGNSGMAAMDIVYDTKEV